jgi:predicted GTPase
MEDMDYSTDRPIDKKTIQNLFTYSFIEQKLNIVISGNTGSGKTYIACALQCRMSSGIFRQVFPDYGNTSEDPGCKVYGSTPEHQLLILDDIGLNIYT